MNTLDEAIYTIVKLLKLKDMTVRTFQKGRSVEITLHRPEHIEWFQYIIRRSMFLVIYKKKEFRRFTRFVIKRNYKYSFNDYKKFVNRLKNFSRDEYFRSLGL